MSSSPAGPAIFKPPEEIIDISSSPIRPPTRRPLSASPIKPNHAEVPKFGDSSASTQVTKFLNSVGRLDLLSFFYDSGARTDDEFVEFTGGIQEDAVWASEFKDSLIKDVCCSTSDAQRIVEELRIWRKNRMLDI